jgi:hypothetical protein
LNSDLWKNNIDTHKFEIANLALRTVGQPTLNGAQIAKTPVVIPDDMSQKKYLK